MAKTIKIAIFNKKATKDQVLFSNGDALDNICIMCSVDENIVTGEYTLDATFLIDEESKLHDLIEEEAILKVKVDYGYEIFRIRRVDKDTKDIQVVASQITITETLSLQLEDVRPENQNGLSALQWMLDKSKGVKEITLFSDIETINTAYYEDMNMYKAIHDCDQSFLNRWGGEILRRGYTLNINKRIGQDRGFTVMHGKNLTGFEVSSNIDSVVTRIKPKGFNGITIDGYVNSGLIDKYARVHTATIKYDDIKVKDESNSEGFDTLEQAQEELIKRAKEEFTKKHIDEIFAEYRVNFAHLEKTEEYKNYAVLERVYLGDSIKVKVKKLDIDITVRAIRRIYDVLRQAVEEIELSNEDISEKRKEAPPTIGELVNRIENVDENSKNFLQEAKDHATNLIRNGLKDSCVIVKENEILIMDTKDINTSTKVWRWNINGLGYSSTGYYGEYGTAITMDGQIVANFITTGLLTANVIKLGVLESLNKRSWINMENGTFNFADNLTMDENGKIKFTGTINNEINGVGIGISLDGVELSQRNASGNKEIVGGFRTGWFTSNKDMNGINICNTSVGDYIAFSGINQQNFEGVYDYNDIVRIITRSSQFFNNFVGMDVRKNFNVMGTSTFCDLIEIVTSSTNKNNHQIYNSEKGTLCVLGDNGLELGYRKGTENMNRIKICESPISNNCSILTWGNIDMNGGVIKNGSIANTYANTFTRTATELTTVQSENNEVRYIYENVQLNNGKAILNIPKRYSGINNGYTISSIVKKGQGDVWVSEEFEDRFILNSDKDIKVNVEIVIKLNNSILIKEGSDTYNGAKSSKCS